MDEQRQCFYEIMKPSLCSDDCSGSGAIIIGQLILGQLVDRLLFLVELLLQLLIPVHTLADGLFEEVPW